jgi:hypothetical protein
MKISAAISNICARSQTHSVQQHWRRFNLNAPAPREILRTLVRDRQLPDAIATAHARITEGAMLFDSRHYNIKLFRHVLVTSFVVSAFNVFVGNLLDN